MTTWLTELWLDFWQRTVLFPIELGVLIVFILVFQIPAVSRWAGRNILLRRIGRSFRRLANQRRLAVTVVFVFTLAGHYLLETDHRAPVPGLHDEYSYLLAGDTFSHGRLTNPPHPMRYFFESFHILMEPTYMSMYPPGQGMALALGTVIAGHPIAGVWLSAAAACAAICWMLQGWMIPQWALLGGLLAAIRIGWFSYWANSYYGGAVAMFGGALLFGALARFFPKPSRLHAGLLALGALILVNSRPLEGVLVSTPVFLWLVWRLLRVPATMRKQFLRPVLAGMLVLLAGVAWMGYYNWTITGDPLMTPYSLNRSRYALYYWLVGTPPNRAISYNFPELARFYHQFEGYVERDPYWSGQLSKPVTAWWFFFGPALTVPLLGLWRLRVSTLRLSTPMLVPASAVAVFFLGNLAVVWALAAHYAAPLTAPIYMLLITGLRRLRVWRRNKPFPGRALVRATLLCCGAMAVLRSAAPTVGLKVFGEPVSSWYSYGVLANYNRQKIERGLADLGGKHLVLVQYSPNHPAHIEWVYNAASIDDATVVWARVSPNPVQMAALLNYFRDRRVWVVYPDQNPSKVFPYNER